MKKFVGYIILAAGLLFIALSYPAIRISLKIAIPAGITDLTLMIVGIVVALVGGWIVFKGKGARQAAEVPIYHGREVVGYRVLGKK